MTGVDVFLQQLVNGLTIGLIYALVALGYSLVYGIIRLINFAHGEIFMVGSYLGLLGTVLAASIPGIQGSVLAILFPFGFAMLCTALLGAAIERWAYRPLQGAPRLSPLITAIGLSFVLQNAVMLIAGPKDKQFPEFLPLTTYQAGSLTVTNIQLLIAVFSTALMLGFYGFIRFDRKGIAMRALADDRIAAHLVGIPVSRIIALAFFMGSAAAGAGGVLFGLYYRTINFHDGYLLGLKAFTAAVLGGIGNIPGAMLGGILLGVVEGLGAGYLSSEWKNVISFVILIGVLLVRPYGLLGSRVVEKV